MSKNRSAAGITNIVQYDANKNITFVSGSATLLTVSSSGALTTTGTITAQTLVVQTVTSSVNFITGSTKFGSISSNTHTFTGSISVSGSGTFVDTVRILTGANTTDISYAVGKELATNNTAFFGWRYNSGTPYGFISVYGTSGKFVLMPDGGNVGIGTSTYNYRLAVYNSSDGTTAAFGGTGYGLRIDNGGTFSSGMTTIFGVDNSFYGSYQPLRLSASTLIFAYSNTEAMRISSAGALQIGVTTSAYNTVRLQVYAIGGSTEYGASIQLGDGNASPHFIDFNVGTGSGGLKGSISYNGTNTLFNGSSDYRLKEDLKDFNGLSIVNSIKTYDFKWKESEMRDYGVMAHELQEIMPNIVTGKKDDLDKDGNIKAQGVDYSKIVPVLVKAIQELKAEIDALKAQ